MAEERSKRLVDRVDAEKSIVAEQIGTLNMDSLRQCQLPHGFAPAFHPCRNVTFCAKK